MLGISNKGEAKQLFIQEFILQFLKNFIAICFFSIGILEKKVYRNYPRIPLPSGFFFDRNSWRKICNAILAGKKYILKLSDL